MTHTITEKHPKKRIILIATSDPYDFRTETTQIITELQNILGTITETVYMIYDVRNLSINFSSIIDAVSGFARPNSEFAKQLDEHGRMILVGAGTLVNVGAKTAARFSPEKPLLVFKTPEEALAHAQAELAKQ